MGQKRSVRDADAGKGVGDRPHYLDVETLQLSVTSPAGMQVLSADLKAAEGRQNVEAFTEQLVSKLRERPTLVRSQNGHFMDKPDNVVSLINLATLRSLEALSGCSLNPLRFRTNLYIDGARPWEEFDWIGGTLLVNETVLRVDRRNGRCAATDVNPATGQRDLELPRALRTAFGHKDLGVYLLTERTGTISVGDTVRTPDQTLTITSATVDLTVNEKSRQFICQGCYYIYDEAIGVPAAQVETGTPLAALPADWRCPDCGTDSSKLELYDSSRDGVADADRLKI